MPAYLAVPDGSGPWPGVVVVHDFTGMSQDLRRQAEWLAANGFLAIAPDLYWWGSRIGCLWTIMKDLAAQKGRTFDDIDAARTWLAQRADCTGRMGIIGFCMGGGYALAFATGHDLQAASVNYGGCPKDAERQLIGACPVVGSYGGDDRSPMGASAADRLDRALDELGIDHDVKIYPGAGHGFMNDHDRADQTPLLMFLARISRTRFDPEATSDARARITAFFHRHLD